MHTPKAAVSIVIFSYDRSHVLLIKRRDIPVWVLPGGGIEQLETPEEAALREAKEEVGCNIQITRKIGEYLPVNRLTQLTYSFEAVIVSGAPTVNEESQDIQFYPVDSLPKLMPPPYKGWILDAHANSPAVLQKKIEGCSYFVLIKLILQHPILVGRFLLTKIGIHINS